MDIKPIETTYKGYRFRSRLEARWAVTFDKAGLDWEYESQGYDVDGKRYLPDFIIPSKSALIEIKPYIPESIPTLYMAGSMSFAEDLTWRGGWRPVCLPDICAWEKASAYEVISAEGRFEYSGPFGDWMSNHSFRHGLDGAAWCYEKEILERSLKGIDQADFFLALIDRNSCYGTLVEIGYAKGKGIPIFIALVDQCAEDDPEEYRFEEIWFASECATKRKTFKDYISARDWLLECAGVKPRPEVGLLEKLSGALNHKWAIVYGPPGDHHRVGTFGFRLDQQALDAGRSARFEHGQSGAR